MVLIGGGGGGGGASLLYGKVICSLDKDQAKKGCVGMRYFCKIFIHAVM